jgi:hypothetical protein
LLRGGSFCVGAGRGRMQAIGGVRDSADSLIQTSAITLLLASDQQRRRKTEGFEGLSSSELHCGLLESRRLPARRPVGDADPAPDAFKGEESETKQGDCRTTFRHAFGSRV